MKENNSNRILSLLICLVMIVGMISAFCLPVSAIENAVTITADGQTDVSYNGDPVYIKFVPEETALYRFASQTEDYGDPQATLYVQKEGVGMPATPDDLAELAYSDDEGYDCEFEITDILYADRVYYLSVSAWCSAVNITVLCDVVKEASAIELSGPSTVYRGSVHSYNVSAMPNDSVLYEHGVLLNDTDNAAIDENGEIRFIGAGEVIVYAEGYTSKNILSAEMTVTVIEPELVDFSETVVLSENESTQTYGSVVKFNVDATGFYRFNFSADYYNGCYQIDVFDGKGDHIGSYSHGKANDIYLVADEDYYVSYEVPCSGVTGYCTMIEAPYTITKVGGDSIVAYEKTEEYVEFGLGTEGCAGVDVFISSSNEQIVSALDNMLVMLAPGSATIKAQTGADGLDTCVDVTVLPAEVLIAGESKTLDFTAVTNGASMLTFVPETDGNYTFAFYGAPTATEVFTADSDGNRIILCSDYGSTYKMNAVFEAGNTYYLCVAGEREYTVLCEKTVTAEGIAFERGESIKVGLNDLFDLDVLTVPFNSYDEPYDIVLNSETSISGNKYIGFYASSVGSDTVTASTGGEGPLTATTTVTVTAAEPISCGETKTKSFGADTVSYTYEFEVTEDGYYMFVNRSDCIMNVNGVNCEEPFVTDYFEQGQKCYIIVKGDGNKTWSGSLSVYDCDDVTSLSIPVYSGGILWNALNVCDFLEEITIANENDYYEAKDGIVYSKSGEKGAVYCAPAKTGKVVLDKDTAYVGAEAFMNVGGITEVVMPETLKRINAHAFYRSGIEVLKIPQSVTRIDHGVFSYCDSLGTVTIPKSVKVIGSEAFCETAITDVYYEGTEEEFDGISIENYGNDKLLTAVFHYSQTTCTHVYINSCDTDCDVCGDVREVTHSFGGYVSDNNATAEADGTKTRTCTVCGYKETVTAEGTKFSVPAPTPTPDPAPSPEEKPVEIADTTKVFTDVKAGKWYTNAINYTYSHGFIAGVSETEFGRDQDVTRGMFITILARIAGVDTSKNANKVGTRFTDVKSGKYYTAAIKWASENGVASGLTDTAFGPEASIERQQLCTMIVNFAKYMNIQLTETKAKVAFADAKSIRKYARNAVSACQKAEIVSGYTVEGGTEFKPLETATRAEAAQILYKFHKDFVVE